MSQFCVYCVDYDYCGYNYRIQKGFCSRFKGNLEYNLNLKIKLFFAKLINALKKIPKYRTPKYYNKKCKRLLESFAKQEKPYPVFIAEYFLENYKNNKAQNDLGYSYYNIGNYFYNTFRIDFTETEVIRIGRFIREIEMKKKLEIKKKIAEQLRELNV